MPWSVNLRLARRGRAGLGAAWQGWVRQAGLGGTGLDKFRHGMVRQANTHGKTEAVSISVITKMRKVFSYGWY
jgi:hypothetical protein